MSPPWFFFFFGYGPDSRSYNQRIIMDRRIIFITASLQSVNILKFYFVSIVTASGGSWLQINHWLHFWVFTCINRQAYVPYYLAQLLAYILIKFIKGACSEIFGKYFFFELTDMVTFQTYIIQGGKIANLYLF